MLGPAEFPLLKKVLVPIEEFMLRRLGRGALVGERAGILKESCRHGCFNYVGVIKGEFFAIIGGFDARADAGACILRRPVVGRPDEHGLALRKVSGLAENGCRQSMDTRAGREVLAMWAKMADLPGGRSCCNSQKAGGVACRSRVAR